MSEHREFSSYQGLDRVALFMGVPLLPAVFLLTLGVFIMMVGMYFFGMVGFLFAVVTLPFAFMLRTISQTDDRAINMLMLEMKFRGKRAAYELFGDTLTYMPERYMREKIILEETFQHFDGKPNE